jgi:hypothetical protein
MPEKKPVSLYLEPDLLVAMDETWMRLYTDYPSKPNRSAMVTCAIRDWIRSKGGKLPRQQEED